VLHVTPSHNIIARTSKIPKIGLSVIDEKLNVVGKVFDVIGPISSPYVIVRPAFKKPGKLTNKQLYLSISKKEWSKKE
jgi:RNA-binding protein